LIIETNGDSLRKEGKDMLNEAIEKKDFLFNTSTVFF